MRRHLAQSLACGEVVYGDTVRVPTPAELREAMVMGEMTTREIRIAWSRYAPFWLLAAAAGCNARMTELLELEEGLDEGGTDEVITLWTHRAGLLEEYRRAVYMGHLP